MPTPVRTRHLPAKCQGFKDSQLPLHLTSDLVPSVSASGNYIYPLLKFLCYYHFSPPCTHFLANSTSSVEPTSYTQALKETQWARLWSLRWLLWSLILPRILSLCHLIIRYKWICKPNTNLMVLLTYYYKAQLWLKDLFKHRSRLFWIFCACGKNDCSEDVTGFGCFFSLAYSTNGCLFHLVLFGIFSYSDFRLIILLLLHWLVNSENLSVG